MRYFLNHLYRLSGAMAALSLVAICLIVMAQVGGRMIDGLALALTGDQLGLVIPSAAEFAGFFLAGASFMALPYTLRYGGHIRVSLVVQHLGAGIRRWIEVWCLGFSTILTAFFAWNTVLLVLDSLEFEEVSYGIIPVPLWIPQSFMALGLIILTIALVVDFLQVVRGKAPSYQQVKTDDEMFAE